MKFIDQIKGAPCLATILLTDQKIRSKANKLPVAARVFVAIPAALAQVSLSGLIPVALLVDRVAKPIVATFDNTITPKAKARKWALMLPKLIATAPFALLLAGVMAIAIPILFIPIVAARIAGYSKL